MMQQFSIFSLLINGLLICVSFLCIACHNDMYQKSRYKPLEESSFFKDGSSSRPLVPHAIARGQFENDPAFFTGKIGDILVNTFPFPVTSDVLKRGQERFNINCSVCHGRDGFGAGIIVQRGFPTPPSFHTERLRTAPAGHFFDVITNGYGVMYPYRDRVTVEDRWAIVAYIRALQFSQNANVSEIDSKFQKLLDNKNNERSISN
jgi:hypothetical protein